MMNWQKEIYLAFVTYGNKPFPSSVVSTINKVFYRDNIYAIKKEPPLIEKDKIIIFYKSFSWRQVEERLKIVKAKLDIKELSDFTVGTIDRANGFIVYNETFSSYIQTLKHIAKEIKLLSKNSDDYAIYLSKEFILKNIVCSIKLKINYEKIDLF